MRTQLRARPAERGRFNRLRTWRSAVTLLATAVAWATLAVPAGAEGPVHLVKEPLHQPRIGAVAALLPNGEVLIAGGGSGGSFLDTAELYNPLEDSFEPLSEEMKVARYLAVATLSRTGSADRWRVHRLRLPQQRRTLQPDHRVVRIHHRDRSPHGIGLPR